MNDNDKYGLYVIGTDPYLNNTHYVPDIEDLRIGYQFEFFDDDDEDWTSAKITTQIDLCNWTAFLDIIKLRVPYLNNKQIISEGWQDVTFEYQKPDLFIGKKTIEDYYKLVYCYNSKQLQIQLIDDSCLFFGECKSINEFRYICKLLKI